MSACCQRGLYLLILVFCIASTAGADWLPGRVLRVVDGDTLVLDLRGSHYRIDLADIDAPELNQPWGRVAATQLHRRLTGAFVVIEVSRTPSAAAAVGRLRFKDRDIALDLLHAGLAWSTADHRNIAQQPPDRHPYTRAEADARSARRSLWADPRPVPPWRWRQAPSVPMDEKKSATLPH